MSLEKIELNNSKEIDILHEIEIMDRLSIFKGILNSTFVHTGSKVEFIYTDKTKNKEETKEKILKVISEVISE